MDTHHPVFRNPQGFVSLGILGLIVNVLWQPAADLLQYNRAQVVYHAIFNHLYAPEHQLIEVSGSDAAARLWLLWEEQQVALLRDLGRDSEAWRAELCWHQTGSHAAGAGHHLRG